MVLETAYKITCWIPNLILVWAFSYRYGVAGHVLAEMFLFALAAILSIFWTLIGLFLMLLKSRAKDQSRSSGALAVAVAVALSPLAIVSAGWRMGKPVVKEIIVSLPEGTDARSVGFGSPTGLACDSSGNYYFASSSRIVRVDAATNQASVFAGNGISSGFSGDGGPATAASLFYPKSVAVDREGSLYIGYQFNNRVRRVDAATGMITTVAGNGTRGFAGDGGTAASARLSDPVGVAVDSAGTLYIADRGNHRIRKVDAATGMITTVAGNGTRGFAGDGGPATAARLASPRAVAVDAESTLYIAEGVRIRKVDAATGIISTVTSNSPRGFFGGEPASDIAVDGSGALYIAYQRIRRVDPKSGMITTVAGNGTRGFAGDGGAATAARLSLGDDSGVVVCGSETLYIADRDNHRIRKVDLATGIITTAAGNGSQSFGSTEGPMRAR